MMQSVPAGVPFRLWSFRRSAVRYGQSAPLPVKLRVRTVRRVRLDRGLCGAILRFGEASRQHVYASQGGDAIQRLALPVNYGVQVRNGFFCLVYQA